MLAALLLAGGGWLLLRQVVPVDVGVLAVLAGGVLVGARLRGGPVALLLVGAPLAGAGAGLLARLLVDGSAEVAVVLAGLAAGSAAAAVVRGWAAVPAVGAGALALATSGLDVALVLPRPVAGTVLAGALTGLGLVLLASGRLTRVAGGSAAAGLLVVVTCALAVLASDLVPSSPAVVERTSALEIPALDGRPLVVEVTRARTVLREGALGGETAVVGAGVAGAGAPVEVVDLGDRVVVRERGLPGTAVTVTLSLPAGTRASVLGGSGDVSADLRGHALDVATTSGAVTVVGRLRVLDVRTGSGPTSVAVQVEDGDEVRLRSDAGDVDARLAGTPRVTAEAATLSVEGFGEPLVDGQRFGTSDGLGSVTVSTASGSAAVVRTT